MQEPDTIPAERRYATQSCMEVALLHDLVRWREMLARSIARNNPELRSEQIQAAVNRILFPLLLLRVATDRHLLPEGMLASLRNLQPPAECLTRLAPYADALYGGEPASLSHPPDPGTGIVIDGHILQGILDALAAPEQRYDCGQMTTIALAQVLMQYLAQTIRRSAAHQAMVVDTHDTVVSAGTVIPPATLIDYLTRQALQSAMRNRSRREVLPLRIFDPACGAGATLLAAYRHLLNDSGGPLLTFDERREILVHSVYGLDTNRHAVAATRMLLFLELCNGCDVGGFFPLFNAVLRDLCHTILCGNALIGPAIVEDESWMFCPARDRHRLNPFSYADRFSEIVASGGFDAVVCNPPEGPLEQREWIQQYFQRRYVVYHPRIDRSAYFVEKSLSLVHPGGTVAMLLNGRWLRGSAGAPLREVLSTRQIEEIVDLSAVPAGNPGAGLCLLRVAESRPAGSLQIVIADATFPEDPEMYADAHRFPFCQNQLDAGGWAFRDTRADEIIRKVCRHSTPLEDVVMGQVHPGIRIPEGSPFLIEEALAREWLRQDPRCKSLLRPIIAGDGIGCYHPGAGRNYLILIPQGWTLSHMDAKKKPWQWLKHRCPLIAKYLKPFSEQLIEQTGTGELWWEIACDEFWQKRRKKIISPARFTKPAFWSDSGRGICDEESIALPSAGLYLAGILNSRLMMFVFDSAVRQKASDRKIFTWDDLARLPIYTPDLDRPEDRARYDRMETLVRRMLELGKHAHSAQSNEACEAIQKKIRITDQQIDVLVCEIYGLTLEEIAVVAGAKVATDGHS